MDHPSDQLTKTPWWHSRRKRRMVLVWISLIIALGVYFYFDIKQPFPILFAIWCPYPIEWLWFRFFDPQYPEHDCRRAPDRNYSGPPELSMPPEAVAGFVGAIAIVGAIVLLIIALS